MEPDTECVCLPVVSLMNFAILEINLQYVYYYLFMKQRRVTDLFFPLDRLEG